VTETVEPVAAQIDQQRLAEVLVAQAREEGVQLVGEGGLLTGLTKAVVDTAVHYRQHPALAETLVPTP
jgi:putative transposase